MPNNLKVVVILKSDLNLRVIRDQFRIKKKTSNKLNIIGEVKALLNLTNPMIKQKDLKRQNRIEVRVKEEPNKSTSSNLVHFNPNS